MSMQTFHAKPKKWGNSVGVVIPKDILEAEGVQEDEEIEVAIIKRRPSRIWELAGTLKTNKTTQQIMDEIDEGWDD